MKNKKNFALTLILGSMLSAGIFFILGFSSQTEQKQFMLVEFKESGLKGAVGLFAYVPGEQAKYTQLETYDPKPEQIIKTGTIIANTINDYYKQGWKLVGTTSPGAVGNTTRLYFEK